MIFAKVVISFAMLISVGKSFFWDGQKNYKKKRYHNTFEKMFSNFMNITI